MNEYLSPYLCGCRRGFNTQTPLSPLIEKCYINEYGAAILMHISKAFDTISHEPLIAS